MNHGSALEAIFAKYKEPNRNAFGAEFIGLDGTLAYLDDLAIDPEDVRALVLAWRLGAKEVGVFEHDPFIEGWTKVGVSTLDQMNEYIERTSALFSSDDQTFLEIYRFTFGFSLDRNEKQLPLEEAVDLWRLLLASGHGEGFYSWLVKESGRKTIRKDEWNMVPGFLALGDGPQLVENYSEEDAWPLLMDEYVEYLAQSYS